MKSRLILLVEDNSNDELLTIRALKKANVTNEIVVARDGVEALDYIFGTGARAEHGPLTPAIVLLDIKLPKLDGLEVLERIRDDERARLFPVIMLTSSNEEWDVVRSYELGVNSYIRKPVEFDAFSKAVEQLGLYWLLLNEPLPQSG